MSSLIDDNTTVHPSATYLLLVELLAIDIGLAGAFTEHRFFLTGCLVVPLRCAMRGSRIALISYLCNSLVMRGFKSRFNYEHNAFPPTDVSITRFA